MNDTPYNARYTKLSREVWKQNFNTLKVGNWLRQRWDTYIICKCQYLSLSIWSAKKIYQVFDADPRLVECHPKLSLRTKVFFILGIIWDERDLPQSSTNGDNNITSSGDGSRQGTSFSLCNEFRNVIGYAQFRKVRAVNDRKARGDKTLDFQVRSEWSGGHILDVIAYSALC